MSRGSRNEIAGPPYCNSEVALACTGEGVPGETLKIAGAGQGAAEDALIQLSGAAGGGGLIRSREAGAGVAGSRADRGAAASAAAAGEGQGEEETPADEVEAEAEGEARRIHEMLVLPQKRPACLCGSPNRSAEQFPMEGAPPRPAVLS